MTSLDQTLEHLRHFDAQLRRFNEALRASYREVSERHQEIEGLWRDESARTYHKAFDDFDRRLAEYLTRHAPRFEEFLGQRVRQLDAYLHGGGG